MGEARMTASKWNPSKYPAPAEKELVVRYDPDTDILTLWNGTPASNGSSIAQNLMVFFDEDDEAQIVTLEHASTLLLPMLEKAASRVSQ